MAAIYYSFLFFLFYSIFLLLFILFYFPNPGYLDLAHVADRAGTGEASASCHADVPCLPHAPPMQTSGPPSRDVAAVGRGSPARSVACWAALRGENDELSSALGSRD